MWEEVVNDELICRGIDSIDKLNVRSFEEAFDVTILYCNYSSRIVKHNKTYYCILDARKPSVLQYEDLLHEIAHIIYDNNLLVENNRTMYIYKEQKIDYLVPLIAIPKFALRHVWGKTIDQIALEFGISRALAFKRLQHIINKGVDKYEGGIIRTCID